MKTKGRFLVILATLALLVSMMSAIPAIGAVAGTVTLTGGVVTDTVRWYSTQSGSNIATVSVTDQDKNVLSELLGTCTSGTIVNFKCTLVGLAGSTTYQMNHTFLEDVNQDDIPDGVLIRALQAEASGFITTGTSASSGAVVLTGALGSATGLSRLGATSITADILAGSLDTPVTNYAKMRAVITNATNITAGNAGNIIAIKGTSVNATTLAETALDSEALGSGVIANGNLDTTKFWKAGTVSFAVDVSATFGGNFTLALQELGTVAARYKYNQSDAITGRTTLASSAHPTSIALTLNETNPSSGVFTATATLTSTIGDHSTAATNTATVYVTDGALLTFSYNDQDPVATITSTARADLKAPTITLISPVHNSSTNVGALSFVVTVTDEASADGKASGLTTTDVDNIVVNGVVSADLTPLLIGTNSFQTSYSQTITSQGLTKWWFPVKDKVGNTPVFLTTVSPVATAILGAGNPASPTTEPTSPFKVTIDTAAPTVDTSTLQTGGKLTTATTTPFATTWGADTSLRKNVTVKFNLGGTGFAPLDLTTLSASAWSVGGVAPSSAAMNTDGDTVVLTMAADQATDATPKVELVTAGLKDKANNTMATLTGTAAPTALDRLKPVLDVSLSPTTITKTTVTITVTSSETLNASPAVTIAENVGFTGTIVTSTVTATGVKSWTAAFTAPATAASKRWVQVVGTDLTGSNTETRGEGTPSTDRITFEVDTAAPSKQFPDATATPTAGAVWIVVRYDEDEYTGDTQKAVTVVSATLQTGTATAVSVASDVFIGSTTLNESGGALGETHATVTLAKTLAVGTYTFVIVVKDAADNSSTSFTHTLTVSAKPPFEITLNPGVNLISIPGDLVGDGANINVAFTGLPVTAVLTYDAARNKAGQNPWLSSTKSTATGLFTGDIAVLAPGKAYFVTADARAILKLDLVTVGSVLPPVVQVLLGYNVVGFWSIQGNLTTTTNNTADADAYLGSTKWSVAYGFDPTPGVGWQAIRPDGELTDGPKLKAGVGYLVYFTQDGTLTP